MIRPLLSCCGGLLLVVPPAPPAFPEACQQSSVISRSQPVRWLVKLRHSLCFIFR